MSSLGLEEELEKQTLLVLQLQLRVKQLSSQLSNPDNPAHSTPHSTPSQPARTSTPNRTPPSNESSLYLSPILNQSERESITGHTYPISTGHVCGYI